MLEANTSMIPSINRDAEVLVELRDDVEVRGASVTRKRPYPDMVVPGRVIQPLCRIGPRLGALVVIQRNDL